MKLALISPKGKISNNPAFIDFWNSSKDIDFYRNHFTGSSSGLLIMASLTPKDWEIDLIDENLEDINFDKDYDLIGLGSMTQQATRAYEIADKFRKKGSKVVMGGIHATVLFEEAKEHVDSVVIGEGEEIWPNVLSDFIDNKLKPYYKSESFFDLTKSPIPRYDLLDPNKYKTIWIQTTRGCPIDCEFCCASNVYGSKFRYKTVNQIVKELEKIKSIWGRKALINFADDNMFVNKKFSSELIAEIKRLKIRWFAQTDISVSDDEDFLTLLKDSGCAILFVGFESLNYDNFKTMNKSNKKAKYFKDYSKIIAKIQRHGIGIMGSFIVGFDGDDVSVFDKTANFIIENDLFATQATVLTPLPGTRLQKRLSKENRLIVSKWDNYTFTNVNFKPNKMSISELEKGLLNIYKKVYSREVTLKKTQYFRKIYIDLERQKIDRGI
ncbi:MAG: radical SAM protein [Candidatus Omnitrophota bacterium]